MRLKGWRVALQMLTTSGFAVGACAWAGRGLTLQELQRRLAEAPLGEVAPVLLAFTLAFFLVDVTGFGLVWRRHLVPGLSWRDVRVLVCGKQVLSAFVPLLTKTVAPLYFWRRWRVRPLRSLGASEVIGAAELCVVLLLVSWALAGWGVVVGAAFRGAVVCAWLLLVLFLVGLRSPWLRHRWPRLREAAVLQAFVHATPGELALHLVLRGLLQGVALGCLWLVLVRMGAHLTREQMLAFGPLFLYSAALPLSIAGFGGPQGLAVALLAEQWQVLSRAQALAFSLVWSTGLLCLQVTVGLLHLPHLLALLGRGVGPAKEGGIHG